MGYHRFSTCSLYLCLLVLFSSLCFVLLFRLIRIIVYMSTVLVNMSKSILFPFVSFSKSINVHVWLIAPQSQLVRMIVCYAHFLFSFFFVSFSYFSALMLWDFCLDGPFLHFFLVFFIVILKFFENRRVVIVKDHNPYWVTPTACGRSRFFSQSIFSKYNT